MTSVNSSSTDQKHHSLQVSGGKCKCIYSFYVQRTGLQKLLQNAALRRGGEEEEKRMEASPICQNTHCSVESYFLTYKALLKSKLGLSLSIWLLMSQNLKLNTKDISRPIFSWPLCLEGTDQKFTGQPWGFANLRGGRKSALRPSFRPSVRPFGQINWADPASPSLPSPHHRMSSAMHIMKENSQIYSNFVFTHKALLSQHWGRKIKPLSRPA